MAHVSILVAWHNRGRPICVTHNATPDARSGTPQANNSGARRGELHIGPGFVPHHPPFVDRHLDAGAKLLARATGMSEIAI